MKKSLLFTVMLSITLLISYAQDESSFGIRFSGFVKTDIFWDSRQTISAREGHFLLYPANENIDADGNDINARPNFNILSIQTRLTGKITGPDAFGAKTSGVIEGSFFGNIESNINSFRLRHAYVKLDWTKTSLLVGQYWHPMFITYCFPGVVSFNTGAPFIPFTRNPQVRLTQKFGDFNLILTALSQLDFVSTGPDGASRAYIRNSAIPTLNVRFEYRKVNSEEGKEFLAGAGLNIKTLAPRIETDSGYKTTEKITTFSETFYLKLTIPKLTFKLQGVYAQDAYNWTMLGGYAVEDVTDVARDIWAYTPITTAAGWFEVHTNGKQWQLGLLMGYTKNMGSNVVIGGDAFERGSNIDYVYRIAPRFIYNAGKFRIAPEFEYTVAGYATANPLGGLNIDNKGKVTDSKAVANARILLGVYYFF